MRLRVCATVSLLNLSSINERNTWCPRRILAQSVKTSPCIEREAYGVYQRKLRIEAPRRKTKKDKLTWLNLSLQDHQVSRAFDRPRSMFSPAMSLCTASITSSPGITPLFDGLHGAWHFSPRWRCSFCRARIVFDTTWSGPMSPNWTRYRVSFCYTFSQFCAVVSFWVNVTIEWSGNSALE